MIEEKQQSQLYKYEAVAKSDANSNLDADDGQVEIKLSRVQKVPVSKKFLYVAACTGNLATFASGTVFGWTSPVVPKLQNITQSPLSEVISQDDVEWIGSLLLLGAVLGPFIGGTVSDKIGRKKTLLYGNVPLIVGLLLNIVATDVRYLLVSRFICGISVGLTFMVLPIYVGEIAEDDVRGILGTLLQLFAVIGLLFTYVAGPYLSLTNFNATCLVVPSVFLITFFLFVPESPYYLLQTGQDKAAEIALMKLRSAKSPRQVGKELQTMKVSIDVTLANKSTFKDIFKSKGCSKAFVLCNGLLVLQPLSGIDVVLFFAQNIFQDAGVQLAPEICTILIGIVQLVSSALASTLIERRGKRPLLMVSALGMAISQGTLAYFFYLKDDSHIDVSSLSWVPILCLIGYIVAYCLGFGPIPWAVIGEMFPANVKARAATVSAANCWFVGFIVTRYFAVMTELVGRSGNFGLFGGFCLLALVFVYAFLPETTGKSLQEIQDILNGKCTTDSTENY